MIMMHMEEVHNSTCMYNLRIFVYSTKHDIMCS